MLRMTIIAAGAAMLLACNPAEEEATGASGDAAGAASEEGGGVLQSLSGDVRPQAGRWEHTATVIQAEIPGMPEGMSDMIVGQMNLDRAMATCMTPEQAEQNPETLWSETNGDCEYESFEKSGDRIDAVAVCRQDGVEMRMVMSGTQTETTYDARNEMTMSMPQGEGKFIVEVEGRRVGDCDGSEMG